MSWVSLPGYDMMLILLLTIVHLFTAGHGTHVVGSIIGNCPRLSIESGVAPAAKVAFFDIGITGSSYLKLPPMSLLLQTLYEAGARVDSFR